MRSNAPATRQASIKSTAPAIGSHVSGKHAGAAEGNPEIGSPAQLKPRRSSRHDTKDQRTTKQELGSSHGDKSEEEDQDMTDAMQISPAPAQGPMRPGSSPAAAAMQGAGGRQGNAAASPARAHAGSHAAAKTPAQKSARTAASASPSPMDVSPCGPLTGAQAAMQASPGPIVAATAAAAGSLNNQQQQQVQRPGQQPPLQQHLPARSSVPSSNSNVALPDSCGSSDSQHRLATDLLRSRLLHRCGSAAAPPPYPPTPYPDTAPSSSSAPAARAAQARAAATPSPPSWALPLRPALQSVHDTLVATMGRVVAEEGCTAAVLLLGERGTGKTLAVERALQTLAAKHASGSTPGGTTGSTSAGAGPSHAAAAAGTSAATAIEVDAAGSVNPGAGPGSGDKLVGVVRISGLLHLEERMAFQEIARQLCQEFEQLFAKSATYDENLAFLRTMLQALHRCMKTVVFIVDELDAFTRKGKQMLLYNLLDTLAHSKVQACVVGISCMQDVMDHMEKRVRSRFSAQRIFITPPLEFEPRAAQVAAPAGTSRGLGLGAAPPPQPAVSFEDTPLGILRAMLSLPTTAAAGGGGGVAAPGSFRAASGGGTAAGRGSGGSGRSSAAAGQGAGQGVGPQQQQQGLDPEFVQRHNGNVSTALQDAAVKQALKQAFHMRLRPKDLANIAQCALLEWTLTWQQQQQQLPQQQQGQGQTGAASVVVPLSAAHVLRAVQQHLAIHASQGDQLAGISVLQLFLVVAMYRLAVKGSDLVNFEMAYDELRCMQYGGTGRGDEQYRWSRGAALRAFQGLLLSGLAVQVGGGQSGERLVGRGAAYAGAELRCGKAVLEAALRARGGACPDLLIRFFRMEA